MKNSILLISVTLVLLACSEKSQTITIENRSEVAVSHKEVVLDREGLKSQDDKLPVIYDADGKLLPTQLVDSDADGAWNLLVFQVSLDSKSTKQLKVGWVNAEEYPTFETQTQVYFGYSEERTNDFLSLDQHVRPSGHEPQDPPYMYQFEGPGWENNLVGYRSYFDTRNGKDIFGKTTEEMVLRGIALGENYHELQSWGMDVLKVGSSLGAGSLAILKQDTLIRLGATAYAEFKKLEEGPVYSSLSLKYKGWDVLGEMYELEETITIWANKRWYGSQVALPNHLADTLVVGIVNLKEANVDQFNTSNFEFLMTYGDQSENSDALGMGLIIPSNNSLGFSKASTSGHGITNSELALLKSENDSYTFFFYAGWEAENEGFANEYFMKSELIKAAEQIGISLEVSIE